MITKQDLLEAIAECQGTRSPNANTAIKLAAFYTIMDHMGDHEDVKADTTSRIGYSFSGPPVVEFNGDSEFALAINGLEQEKVWPVIDELMSTIKIMNERLYNSVMRKLQ